ncbi:hypothetical protein QQF64_026315 [Cirrhinus molitorella]|uniref:Uncharacterized protein n=1 Tax=Cirrhinus molitorella TaxID=172907 RepID=A0ABR3NSB9_9TELE
MAAPVKLRIVLGANNAKKLTIESGMPKSVEDLSKESKRYGCFFSNSSDTIIFSPTQRLHNHSGLQKINYLSIHMMGDANLEVNQAFHVKQSFLLNPKP